MESNVVIIPATITRDGNSAIAKTRVGVYCRVSTSHDEQLNSFYNQIAYYVGYIEDHEDWEFVDFYADEGISGTKTKTRNEFNRMLTDCRERRLDLILVKSISRFARNVADCLKYVRELREHNVDIYFENEHIHGRDMSSEFILSIHAMHAQEQAISTSNNMRWSVNKRMQEGLWIHTYVGYGYKIENDEIVKDQETAPVIEQIKQLYINGYSSRRIAKYLKENQIADIHNKEICENTIMHILTDPFYRGDLIAQKTFTTDSFPFERRWNRGEKDKYVYRDDHLAYINEEEGKCIDEILSRRKSNSFTASQSQARDHLSGKVICASCGSVMKRVIIGTDKLIGYSCKLHIKDYSACQNKTVMKSTIQKGFIRLVNQLKIHKNLLDQYMQDLIVLDAYARNQPKAEHLRIQLNDIKEQIHKTVLEYNQGCHEFAFYVQELRKLKLQEKKIKDEMIQQRVDIGYQKEIKETKDLQKLLQNINIMIDFEEEVFSQMIDKIQLSCKYDVTFILKCGLELSEHVEV